MTLEEILEKIKKINQLLATASHSEDGWWEDEYLGGIDLVEATRLADELERDLRSEVYKTPAA